MFIFKMLKVIAWIVLGLFLVFAVTMWSLMFIGALPGPGG